MRHVVEESFRDSFHTAERVRCENEMDEEKLIELVCVSKNLWDFSLSDYKDNAKTNNSWITIAQHLGVEPSEAKARWRALRDGYIRAKRNQKKRSGNAGSKRPKWKFFDKMSFLEKVLEHRKAESNMPTPCNTR